MFAGLFARTRQTRVVGVLAGYLADLAFGDPQRGHPVAVFGQATARLERVTYRDSRTAGVVHVGLVIGAVGVLGVALQRGAARRGRVWSIAATAAATWMSLGGSSLAHTGLTMSRLLGRRRHRSCATAAAGAVRVRSGPAGRRGPYASGTRIGSGEHVGRRGGSAAVGDGGRRARGFGLPGGQHPGLDDWPPLAAAYPIRSGRGAIG